MSSKRVILFTKGRCFSSKSNQFYGNNASKGLNNNNDEEFNSFNLNKNHKSENIKFEQSKSTPFLKKSQNNNGFFDYKNYSKNALNDWKKNDTPNFHESLKTEEMEKEYKWETNVKKDCNKSALSLHIEAYENLNETKNVTSKTSFDFFKQQNEELMNPEIMQFKTSQKLLNFFRSTTLLIKLSNVRRLQRSSATSAAAAQMSHLYKQYMRLIAKWPRDKLKNDQRNLGFLFERELEKIFKYSPTPPETGVCERRLKALTELVENRHQHDFPHKYNSGIFGMKLQQLQEINSDEFRQQIGLGEPKKSLFARLFARK